MISSTTLSKVRKVEPTPLTRFEQGFLDGLVNPPGGLACSLGKIAAMVCPVSLQQYAKRKTIKYFRRRGYDISGALTKE